MSWGRGDQLAVQQEWRDQIAKDEAETLALTLSDEGVTTISDKELSKLFSEDFKTYKFMLHRVLLEMGIHIEQKN